jgi:hypothetical protein
MGYPGEGRRASAGARPAGAAWTINEIVAELGVSKSSVSVWVSDVEFDAATRPPRSVTNRNRGARNRRPNRLQQRKHGEIERFVVEGRDRIGRLSERDLLVAGTALYAGEGNKTDGEVRFSNSDPRMIGLFCAWLRRFFDVDESRLRVRLYLHQGLDLDAANAFWSELTGIPLAQFGKPYRAIPDPSIRSTKHPKGCPGVSYSCSRTHRAVMGLVTALLSSDSSFRGSSVGRATDC